MYETAHSFYYTIFLVTIHLHPSHPPGGDSPPVQRPTSATPRHLPPLATSTAPITATLRPPLALLARQFPSLFALLLHLEGQSPLQRPLHPEGKSPITTPRINYTQPFSDSRHTYRPLRGNAPPSARAPRAAVPSLFAFLMSLSLSALIRPSMRSIQLALYPQAAPGSPLLPFGGSGFTVRSPMRLSALANRAPCNVSPSAFYASDNPSASSLSFSTQIQLNR